MLQVRHDGDDVDGRQLGLPRHWRRSIGAAAVVALLASLLVPALLKAATAAAGGGPFVAAAIDHRGGGWEATPNGTVVSFSGAASYGDLGGIRLNRPIVGMTSTPDGRGYWLVASDGGVFSFGDATFHGSTGNIRLNQPIVGMATTTDGQGYWLVASDGGVFSFGDATFHGSTGNIRLNRPIVNMSAAADGGGYWLVAIDGGIFTFGDATFHGSAGNIRLAKPVVGMAATPDGGGYWLVASDGGVFTYGDAPFRGSMASTGIPVAAIVPDSAGGYWLAPAYGTPVPYLAPAPPPAPGQVTVSQAGTAADVEVTWSATSEGVAPTGATVTLYHDHGAGSAPTPAGQITCAAGCTSAVFRRLGFAQTYEAHVTATYASGRGTTLVSPPVTLQTGCAASACITIDATQPTGPANHAASGLLGAMFPAGNDEAVMAGLKTTMWRAGPGTRPDGSFDWSSWDVAQRAGAQTTLMLSSLWRARSGGGTAVTPWSDWTSYQRWVTVTVQQVLASGRRVDNWEVYNEPGSDLSYYTPDGAATVTPALLLQQYLLTYKAIKAADPQANIIGPSLEHWTDYPGQYGSGDRSFDMTTFLDFAAANGLQLAAISWHEIDDNLGPNPADNTLSPQNIVDHVTEARQLIAARPVLGNPKIFVNEYGMPEVQLIPGWDVGYLAALTQANVDSADRSCWGTPCNAPSLDAILGNDGISTMPLYWVRAAYAAMTGSMVVTTTSDEDVAALGSIDAAGTVQALVGRKHGCAQEAWCTATWPSYSQLAAPAPVQMTVKVPWAGSARVSLTDIAGAQVSTPLPTPQPQTTTTLPVTGGTVTVTIPSFADGDAYSLTVTRAS